jgi:hypothetical protein
LLETQMRNPARKNPQPESHDKTAERFGPKRGRI